MLVKLLVGLLITPNSSSMSKNLKIHRNTALQLLLNRCHRARSPLYSSLFHLSNPAVCLWLPMMQSSAMIAPLPVNHDGCNDVSDSA